MRSRLASKVYADVERLRSNVKFLASLLLAIDCRFSAQRIDLDACCLADVLKETSLFQRRDGSLAGDWLYIRAVALES